jgi:hypothetical protein
MIGEFCYYALTFDRFGLLFPWVSNPGFPSKMSAKRRVVILPTNAESITDY